MNSSLSMDRCLLAAVLVFGYFRSVCPEVQVFHISSTGSVSLSLPMEESSFPAKVRLADGHWKLLEPISGNGSITYQIPASAFKHGKSLLALNVPSWLDLEDQRPPEITLLELDGKELKDRPEIHLGWVDELPGSFRAKFRDRCNPLDPESVRVIVDGKRALPQNGRACLEMLGTKRGTLEIQLHALLDPVRIHHSMTFQIDDKALDDAALSRTLTFSRVPLFTMPDGTAVEVDSLTNQSAWSHWEVVIDGKIMDSSMRTTVGRVWNSEANDRPHWIRFTFPEKRQVGRVELSWAFWKVFSTSVAYDIQTWNGRKWVTQLKVRNQPEQQTSVHTFKPVKTDRVRVYQPPLSGHPKEPKLMWLAEVKVAPVTAK